MGIRASWLPKLLADAQISQPGNPVDCHVLHLSVHRDIGGTDAHIFWRTTRFNDMVIRRIDMFFPLIYTMQQWIQAQYNGNKVRCQSNNTFTNWYTITIKPILNAIGRCHKCKYKKNLLIDWYCVICLQRIKERMEIPGLRDSLVKILQDYNLQVGHRRAFVFYLITVNGNIARKIIMFNFLYHAVND